MHCLLHSQSASELPDMLASLGNPLRQAAFTACVLTLKRIANSLIPSTQKVKGNMPPEVLLFFSEKFCHCKTSRQVPQATQIFCNFIFKQRFFHHCFRKYRFFKKSNVLSVSPDLVLIYLRK